MMCAEIYCWLKINESGFLKCGILAKVGEKRRGIENEKNKNWAFG